MESDPSSILPPLELKAGANGIFGKIPKFDKNKVYKVHCKKVMSNDKVTEIVPQNQDFMIPSLEPNTQYSVQYGMQEGEDYLWSSSVDVTTYLAKTKKITERYDPLLAELRAFSLDDRVCSLGLNHVNILLIGRVGAGKSSLICTIHSIFEGAPNVTIAPFGASSTSFTPKFRKIPSKFNPHIWFLDIFGMDGNNLEGILDPLLTGRLKEGHKKGDPVTDLDPPSLAEQVHVVILVVEQQTLSQDSEVNCLLQLLTQIRAYGLPTLIVLTKMDTLAVSPMPEIKPSDLTDHYAVLERIKVAKDKLKSQEIYPFINCAEIYLDDDTSRAQQALEILQRALRFSMDFIKDSKIIIEIRSENHPLCSIRVDSLKMNLSSIREEIERTINVPFYFVDKSSKCVDLQEVTKLKVTDICTGHETERSVFVMQLHLLGDFISSEELVEGQVIIQDEEGKSIDAIENVRRKEKVSEFRTKIDDVLEKGQDYKISTKNNKLIDRAQESSVLLESCLKGKEKDFKYLTICLEKINLQIMNCEGEIPGPHLVGLKSNSTLADVRLALERDHKTKITFFAKPLKDGTKVKLKKIETEKTTKAKELAIEENDVKFLYVYT